jgi:protein-tyrosine phosphatase
MIDLHTHVLPGIDDGPEDTVGSVAMAHLASERGTGTLVATPHVRDDYPKVRPDEIQDRARSLNRLVRDYGIDVFIVPGAEIDLTTAMKLSDEDLRLVTLGGNGRDLLIETPYSRVPDIFESMLETVMERGFRVTLAHPELNQGFQENPERLGALAEEGVLVQLTTSSFTRRRRSASRRTASLALERGWVSVLATDAHSPEWRAPDLNPGVQAARRLLPDAEAEIEWMVNDAPLAIVQGRELPERPEREQLSGWQRLRRRA